MPSTNINSSHQLSCRLPFVAVLSRCLSCVKPNLPIRAESPVETAKRSSMYSIFAPGVFQCRHAPCRKLAELAFVCFTRATKRHVDKLHTSWPNRSLSDIRSILRASSVNQRHDSGCILTPRVSIVYKVRPGRDQRRASSTQVPNPASTVITTSLHSSNTLSSLP
jgi:hypothetical protein